MAGFFPRQYFSSSYFPAPFFGPRDGVVERLRLIASAVVNVSAVGTPLVSPGTVLVRPPGIAPDSRLGDPALYASAVLGAAGLTNTSAFGGVHLLPRYQLTPVGVTGASIVGYPTVAPGSVLVLAQSQRTDEVFGSPFILVLDGRQGVRLVRVPEQRRVVRTAEEVREVSLAEQDRRIIPAAELRVILAVARQRTSAVAIAPHHVLAVAASTETSPVTTPSANDTARLDARRVVVLPESRVVQPADVVRAVEVGAEARVVYVGAGAILLA